MATAARSIPAPRLYTAEELADLPDDVRAELVNGEMVMVPLASAAHGSIATRMIGAFAAFVYPRTAGELFDSSTGFILRRDPDVLRAPDVAFVSAERLPTLPARGFLELAPDLAVEILSPSNTYVEMSRKIGDYLRAGARLVWVLDPETRTAAVHVGGAPSLPRVLEPHEALDGGDVLPGFTLPLAQCFAGLPPLEAAAAPPSSPPAE